MRTRFDQLDPEVGLFFEQELTSVQSDITKKEKEPRNAFESFPQDTDDEEWREKVEIRMWDHAGMADFISDYTNDLQSVDVWAEKDEYPVRAFGAAYQYSVDEIKKANALDRDLERKKAEAARDAIERRFNRIQWYGAPVVGLSGIFNFAHFPRRQISIPFNSNQTPSDVVDEINNLVNSPFDLVGGDEARAPDTLLMPPDQYAYISSTAWQTGGTDTTILSFVLDNNPFLETVEANRECKGAGPNGEDVCFAYRRDPKVVRHKMVKTMEQMDPQQRGLAYKVDAWAKSGGIVSEKPLEAVIGEFPS